MLPDKKNQKILPCHYFHQDAIGEYWEDRLPLSWAKDIVDNGIPVLSWGGWQDLNETGALRGYVAFQNEVAGRDIYLPMEEGQKTSPCYQQIMHKVVEMPNRI